MATTEPSLFSAVANDWLTWPCVLFKVQLPPPADLLIIIFAFPVAQNPATSVLHCMKPAEVCQEARNSGFFIHTRCLQAKRS